jgi:hypothetical protein
VRPLLQACLEKDPKRRLRDIGDTERLLQNDVEKATTSDRRRPWFWKFAAATFGVALLATVIAAWIHFRDSAADRHLLRATILPPENTTFDFNFNNGVGVFALSPDGRKLVVSARGTEANHQLWLRSLDGIATQPLPGTDGSTFPFWSPDSRYVGFFADGRLKKIDISGGPPVPLADAMVGRGGTWSKDNMIVFAPGNNDPLYKVSAAGGPAAPVTKYVGEEARSGCHGSCRTENTSFIGSKASHRPRSGSDRSIQRNRSRWGQLVPTRSTPVDICSSVEIPHLWLNRLIPRLCPSPAKPSR